MTVLGRPLTPAAIAAIAGQIAAGGANIDRIGRLARRPVTCIELEVSGADPEALRAALTREATQQGVDVAVQPGGKYALSISSDNTIQRWELPPSRAP